MRRALLAALAAAVVALTACDAGAPEPGDATVDVDTPELRELKAETAVEECVPGDATSGGLPDLTLPCLGGGPDVDLSGLEGPMVINLWASWCGPCRKEMPVLEEFHERYGDRVPVVGIDYQDQQPGAALDLAVETGVSYPLLADPGGDLNALDPLPPIRGLPYLLFLDADGELAVVPGGVETADELVDLANQHLGTDL